MIRQIQHLPEQQEMVSSEHSLDLALRDPHAATAAPKKQNVLKVLHRYLRGRYHWLIILAVLLGGAGGYLGYQRGSKTFASIGAVKINFRIQQILFQDPESTLAAPDAFVQDQITAMTSWRVMVRAVESPDWLGVRPAPLETRNETGALTVRVQELLSKIKVAQKNDQVQVEARDTDPAVAVAAAHAVIDAYKAIYIDREDGAEDDPVKTTLLTRQRDYEIAIQKIWNESIKPIADRYGSDRLDAQYNAKFEQLTAIDTTIQSLKSAIEAAHREMPNEALTTAPATRPMPDFHLSEEQLAANDNQMATLMEMRQREFLAVEIAKRGTSAKALDEANARLKSTQELIIQRRDILLSARAGGISIAGVPPVKNRQDLLLKQINLDVLEPKFLALQDELIAIGTDNLALKQYASESEDLKVKLAQVNNRLEQLKTENPNARRVVVASRGEWPVGSDKDSRPKYAAAGGLGGVMLALGMVMAVGFLSATLKTPRDMLFDMEDRPMLGTIPRLEKGAHATRLAAMAAECVHRSRTMLEIWARGNSRIVIGVTSPSHGSGNTSVAMSLGVSFATAGMRTLLIDCDFVTNGLTPRLQTVVKRDLGKVLLRSGMLKESELEAARQQVAVELNGSAKESDLGEACIKMGLLTQEELERAISIQARDPVGVLDAMNGEPLEACVGRTGIRNLSILPRGNVTPAHAAKLSAHAMREVLASARQQFDTVIIDTSAVLTSLEAGIVASSVDGMVMTVARGEKRGRLREAMQRLGTLQCPVAGVIFNQVLPKDMPPEPKIGRVSTVNNTALDEETIRAANLELVGRLAMLGPLASSMVSRVPVLDERKDWE